MDVLDRVDILKSLVDSIRRQFSNVLSDETYKKLKFDVQKLVSIRRYLQAYYNNLKVVGQDVLAWFKSVDEIQSEAEKIFQSKGCLSPHLKSGYSLSKKAKKKIKFDVKLQVDGKFNDFESRKSTVKEVLEDLKDDVIKMIGICGEGGVGKTTMVKEVGIRAKEENLFDEVVMVIVGKPPDLKKKIQHDIAKLLGLKLEEESLSARAGRIRVRLKDTKRILIILDDVWGRLDLEEVGIPFGPTHEGCKILLTSRFQNVLREMRTQKIVTVEVLSDEEARRLFRESAGNSFDNSNLQSIAQEVVKECGGLPLALVILGRALGDKDEHVLEDALVQLRKTIPMNNNITGVQAKVYQSLQLSYNNLETEEARSIFLLCCLFQEDFDIPVEYLVRYGIGLQLFKCIDTLAEARNMVHALVETLGSFYLLLSSDKKGCVKMHDVVRDFGISIASKDDHALMVRHDVKLKGWRKEDLDRRYTSIVLTSDEFNNTVIPEVLLSKDCPKLELLQLVCKNEIVFTSDDFFKRMGKLKVIDMNMYVNSLPSSLQFLKNLQTLCLEDCRLLENMSIIGELVNLEILSFIGSDGIQRLPEEIGKLANLRLLDLSSCPSLQTISPGVISSLVRLEELYMTNSFEGWEIEEEGKARSNASLRELESLSNLNTLDIHILDLEVLPRNLCLGEKLTKYRISIGEDKHGTSMKWRHGSSKIFQFFVGLPEKRFLEDPMKWPFQRQMWLKIQTYESTTLGNWLSMQFRTIERLSLEGKGLEKAMNELAREGFQHLKDVSLGYCDMLENLATVDWVLDTTRVVFPILESLILYDLPYLKEICYGQLPLGSFGQLRCVELRGNARLRYLFSPSIARGLVQLQELSICECDMMEEVFKERGEDEKSATIRIELPNLKDLKLEKLESLTSFCKGFDEIYIPQLNNLYLQELPELKSFGFKESNLASKGNHNTDLQSLFCQKVLLMRLKNLYVQYMDNFTKIWSGKLQATSFCELRVVDVFQCNNILNVVPSNIIRRLQSLEELKVCKCRLLDAVVDFEELNMEEGPAAVILPCLKRVVLRHLPKLTNIWKGNDRGIQAFQNLNSLKIKNCDSLRTIFSPSIAKLLVELQELKIKDCKILEEIVANDLGGGENKEETKMIELPKLRSLVLVHLPNLVSFCSQPYTLQQPSSVTSGDINIPMQHQLFTKQVAFPSLEVLELDGLANFEVMEQDHLPARSLCKLRELTLRRLPKLTHIYKNDKCSVAFSSLEVLELDGLANLEGMEQDQLPASFLCKLRKLTLRRLPKLVHIYRNDQEGTFFENLKYLTVDRCGILRNLFSASMISDLRHLHELIIDDCSMMKEIIAGEEEQEKGRIDAIEFPELNHLELRKLPRLTSFCHIKCDSEFPLLEKVAVHGCPKMKFFSRGLLRTPKLQGVDVGQHKWVWMGDLNNTIEHIFKAKSFPKDSLYTTIKKRTCRKWVETIARGVAMVAFRGFMTIDWDYYKMLIPRGRKVFKSFKVSVFKAIIKFVLSVYDLEDFEHVVNIDEINNECEEFRNLCIGFPPKSGDDPLTAISERKMDLKGLSMIREQDIGNILKWYQSQYSYDNELGMPKNIGSFAVEMDRQINIGSSAVKPCSYYIRKAIECMMEYVPMKEKDKMHLLMELKDGKCFCTLDAWYMESWREIMKIQDVENRIPHELLDNLEDLASDIHNGIYELAAIKIAGLRKCQRLVVFPLASNVFGQWKDDVIEVVRCAEIERRSQGCRFIGINHLLSCLHRTSIQESIKKLQKKLQHLEPIVDLGEPTTHPVYNIYKSSHDIARTLDDPKTELEHLYLAIVFWRNGTENTDWKAIMSKPEVKEFLESVKKGDGKSSEDKSETSSEVINLWSRFLPDDGKKRHINGSVLAVVKRIQEELESGFSPLQKVERK